MALTTSLLKICRNDEELKRKLNLEISSSQFLIEALYQITLNRVHEIESKLVSDDTNGTSMHAKTIGMLAESLRMLDLLGGMLINTSSIIDPNELKTRRSIKWLTKPQS